MKLLFETKRWLLNRRELSFARRLRQNELLSRDQLSELNWRLRQRLVAFCYRCVPFYRRKYSTCGFEPGDLAKPDDFCRLPILEKEEIRECEQELLNPSLRVQDLAFTTTGGSTGQPLKTYSDPNIPLPVMSWRTLNWWGTDICENSAYLYRAVPGGWRRALQKVLLWPTRRSWISAAQMTEKNMESFYRSLVREHTSYLVGYVGAIDVFATFLDRQGYKLSGLKAVWTTSAPLPQIKRDYFQRIFECDVYTQYGSCEFYWIAAECRLKRGLHVASDIRHVEVLEGAKSLGTGEYGDLVVTDLLNTAFPLVRYRIGDRGRLLEDACACGLPFPLMDYVQGRVSDTLHIPGGPAIPGEYWTTLFDDFTDRIKCFQVHQHKDFSISIYYEPHSGADCREVLAIVRARLVKKVGSGLALKFVESRIDVNDRGKTRYVVSDVGK